MRKPIMWFPNRSDTNRAVQAQKPARGWEKVHVDQEKAQSAKDSHSKNPRWEKNKPTIRHLYHEKVQVGKDQEKAQSEKDSHSKNRGGKKPNQQSGTYTMKHIVSRMSSYFPNRWPLSYLNLTKNINIHKAPTAQKKIQTQRHKTKRTTKEVSTTWNDQ